MRPRNETYLRVLLVPVALVSSGCAGPTTPFGAIWAITPGQARETTEFDSVRAAQVPDGPARSTAAANNATVRMRITPTRQVLHGPSRVRIVIDDPTGNLDDHGFWVRYNGLDVSRSFMERAKVTVDPIHHQIQIFHPKVNLKADADHQIEFAYRSSTGQVAYAEYQPPVCYAFRHQTVLTLGNFASSIQSARQTAQMVEKISMQQGINPGLAVGLVAQESAFNPRAVSWARAVGLTQITPIAEEDLSGIHPDWPRYPGMNNHSFPILKAMILSGKVNSKNEWRLNKEKNVTGGLNYAVRLAQKWSTPEVLKKIRATFKDPELAHTQLVLASYHSGYARVQAAFERSGRRWLKQPELQEARRYVQRILSYCSAFTEESSSDDDTST